MLMHVINGMDMGKLASSPFPIIIVLIGGDELGLIVSVVFFRDGHE